MGNRIEKKKEKKGYNLSFFWGGGVSVFVLRIKFDMLGMKIKGVSIHHSHSQYPFLLFSYLYLFPPLLSLFLSALSI